MSVIDDGTETEIVSHLDSSQITSSNKNNEFNIPTDDITKIMKINYAYPHQTDPHFQAKLYKKREYYYNKIPDRKPIIEYDDIKKFRDMACGGQFRLRSQQTLLTNFLNPNTPFKGLLVYHGVGTGKCVHPETKVTITRDGLLFQLAINKLWDNNNTNISIDNDGGEWMSVYPTISAYTYDIKINNIKIRPIDKIYREWFNGSLRKIKLSNNQTIICSINHAFYVYKYGWKNEVHEGDVLVYYDLMSTYYVTITSIMEYSYTGYIYDLEIKDTHAYIANNIVVHNTCAAISVAETFKDQVRKYGTKIYILVGGPLLKEQWREELIKCTGETYFKDLAIGAGYVDENEKKKQIKQSKLLTQQYYKIMSYQSFYKKVLGMKIIDKDIESKKKYRKTTEGEYERDISIDRIDSLDNTLLIIDEAHNITDNERGIAVKKIINNSKNLKILLLTATPMINFADEIIELLNYLRPVNDQIDRDKVFTGEKSHLMAFKSEGKKYLQQMANGYVSHFRGLNPLTFAEEVDIGTIPQELLFTKLYRCKMLSFQQETYDNVLLQKDDRLDRSSQAVSNFCFPGLSSDKKSIVGYYAKDGLDTIRSQLKSTRQLLQKMINDKFFEGKFELNDIVKESNKEKSITGLIFKKENIKYFSVKFYNALDNLSKLVNQNAGTVFFYFNLVKVGVDLFTEVLDANGYLEYNENNNYNITDDTLDAVTGLTYKKFNETHSRQTFNPATYVTMTGQGEDTDDLPEIKMKILREVFNNISNKDGSKIKLVIGSRVMTEGITLENVAEVHIMDVYYNLGKVHQVIGRALRECKHYKIISDTNPFPKVNVYRYVVSIADSSSADSHFVKNQLTTEEQMYQKAELKYMLVKDTERLLKEIAFDCPLNYHGNIFPEEIIKYKDCIPVTKILSMNDEQKIDAQKNLCPSQCDMRECSFKCFDDKLNFDFYDNTRQLYKHIPKNNLDYSTFTTLLAKSEINYAKEKLKELYKFRYVYTLEECINKIKKSYVGEKQDLFDEFFVFKALDDIIPITENDFNNFADTIYDKFNVPGYIIYRNKFYIFQPFDENEDVPMFYRTTYHSELFNDLSLYDYLKTTDILNIIETKGKKENKKLIKETIYNFDDVIEYYESKPEFDYVGIIDKGSIKKIAVDEVIPDVFKIKPKKITNMGKKRGFNIPTIKGTVCETSSKKKELYHLAKHIGIDVSSIKLKQDTRGSKRQICKLIASRMLYLEKYSTEKDKNKFTYLIIPSNHPLYSFPLNLEDKVTHIFNKIKLLIPIKFNSDVERMNDGIFEEKRLKQLPRYKLLIKNNKDLNKFEHILINNGFELIKNNWQKIIE